jgi:hypothetical protein
MALHDCLACSPVKGLEFALDGRHAGDRQRYDGVALDRASDLA